MYKYKDKFVTILILQENTFYGIICQTILKKDGIWLLKQNYDSKNIKTMVYL